MGNGPQDRGDLVPTHLQTNMSGRLPTLLQVGLVIRRTQIISRCTQLESPQCRLRT